MCVALCTYVYMLCMYARDACMCLICVLCMYFVYVCNVMSVCRLRVYVRVHVMYAGYVFVVTVLRNVMYVFVLCIYVCNVCMYVISVCMI